MDAEKPTAKQLEDALYEVSSWRNTAQDLQKVVVQRGDRIRELYKANEKAQAQAAQLAEALQKLHLSIGSGHEYEAVKQAKQALAAYEEGK